MSGISPTAPSNLSSVGASLQATGSAPVATPPAAASPTSGKISPYEAAYQNLNQYDTQELLYASFLSPQDSLANGNAVLQQAATLLGSPGHPGTLATSAPSTPPASAPTSTSTGSGSLENLPSVSSILAASDQAAQTTLAAYANAPAGSSILDVQA